MHVVKYHGDDGTIHALYSWQNISQLSKGLQEVRCGQTLSEMYQVRIDRDLRQLGSQGAQEGRQAWTL